MLAADPLERTEPEKASLTNASESSRRRSEAERIRRKQKRMKALGEATTKCTDDGTSHIPSAVLQLWMA